MKEQVKPKLYELPASIIKDLIDGWTSKTPKTAKAVQYTMITIGLISTAATVVVPVLSITIPVWVVPVASFVSAIGTQFIKE